MFYRLFGIISCIIIACSAKGQDADLSFNLRDNKSEIILRASNHTYSPLLIAQWQRNDNYLLKEFIVPSMDSLVLMRWDSSNKVSIKSFLQEHYRFEYFFGDSTTNPDHNYRYRLPFKKGEKYEVSQGYHGKVSHNHPSSAYAIDFQLKVGEPVHAAREGLVVKAIGKFREHGGRAHIDKANKIIVLHDDGTTASYVHLDYEGVIVKEGQQVKKGELIGYSGMTGYTRGPHLHFVVRKARDISIPVTFEGYEHEELKPGKRYKVVK